VSIEIRPITTEDECRAVEQLLGGHSSSPQESAPTLRDPNAIEFEKDW
jgi:hypothetical protein